ncbi:DUF2061 domain-containing protein [Flavobacteriaceae bacterium]|nr:DUF2061 domain-containing protein [Flavobacteriaceae bacterium]
MIFDLHLFRKNKSKEGNASHEKVSRSLLKAISWRLIGTIDTIIIAYFITGTISQAISIGFIEWGTKLVLYFFHERIWNKFQWGKK